MRAGPALPPGGARLLSPAAEASVVMSRKEGLGVRIFALVHLRVPPELRKCSTASCFGRVLTAADSNSSENDCNTHFVSVLRGAVKENAEQGDRAPFR